MYNSRDYGKQEMQVLSLRPLWPYLLWVPRLARAQAPASDIPVDEIIRKFSEKEKEFKTGARQLYVSAGNQVQELSDSDRVIGEYQNDYGDLV